MVPSRATCTPSIEPGVQVEMTVTGTRMWYGTRSRSEELPQGVVESVSARYITVTWDQAPHCGGEKDGLYTFAVPRAHVRRRGGQ
jgi:hypothetical protein